MQQPPKYAKKFLNWFIKPELEEEVMGDLEENFYEKLKQQSPFRARTNYWYQTINYLRPFALKNNLITDLNPFFMWQHNLKITFRKFQRNKIAFGINLIGLSTGLTCALLIFMWVQDELSVDRFHEKDAQLYQVFQNYEFPQEIKTTETSSLLLADALADVYPEIETTASISMLEEHPKGILSLGDKDILAQGIFATKNYFEIFSIPLISGDKSQVVREKNSIALSKDLALKLFNSTEVIGKMVAWKNQEWAADLEVTGVFEKPPANSTQQFDFLLSMQHLWDNEHAATWRGDYVETFLVLREGIDIDAFNHRIEDFLKTQFEHADNTTLFVQKFSERYLNGSYENGQIVGGRIAYTRLFSLIALFILLIACINFMNLSTAQAATKMKEVGVKKAIGARRKSLVNQFLGESFWMVLISTIVAIVLANVLIPQFNNIAGKNLLLRFSAENLLALIGIILLTTLLSGSYAAFYLSSFNPVAILKGKVHGSLKGQLVRKGLVVFQFSLSVIFIVGVLIVNQQMDYIQTKKLGYNRSNVLSFERPNFRDKSAVFLNNLRTIPTVMEVGSMFDNVLSGAYGQSGYSWRGEDSDQDYLFKSPLVSYDALETLSMELVKGRTFSRAFQKEREKIIINESAAKMMGFEEPVGQLIKYGFRGHQREIIGVVKDFHYGSIHHQIEPLIFRFSEEANNVMIKVKAGTEQSTITAIEKVFKEFHPAYPFNYTFLEKDYQRLYESESKVATLSTFFSGLAVIISCLGLFGLAMFTAERRRKEIGIRKVLGASVFGIVQMLTKDFTKTVLIAILIATPLSYWIAQNWLANFAYKIDLQSWHFVVPGLLILLVAWSTVGLQTLQAASVNPVQSLKDE